jgi:hypothetical protein
MTVMWLPWLQILTVQDTMLTGASFALTSEVQKFKILEWVKLWD